MGPRKSATYLVRGSIALLLLVAFAQGCTRPYHTFADYPGFEEFYRDRCVSDPVPISGRDLELLRKYRPRFVLPPGGAYPIDFYRDYIPYTVMRTWPDGKPVAAQVNRGLLQLHQADRRTYLDFDRERYRAEGLEKRMGQAQPAHSPDRPPVVYGRIYREPVSFPATDGTRERRLTFLKYNLVFASSGLAADLPVWLRLLLGLTGWDPDDWHELDNFVAVHVVLDENEVPVAALLAQHNHHRAYLIGRDLFLPEDSRLSFDIALRSNEVYPSSRSPNPVRHRVVRWSLYMDYLLSGENGPLLRAQDVTRGVEAGGGEFDYDLKVLSPCDPLYTSRMLLGEPRPFLGMYLGRDGPPGSDYYTVPRLLPLGNTLKFSYLHDGDREDIAAVREAVDERAGTMDADRLMEHGGRRFLEDWEALGDRE